MADPISTFATFVPYARRPLAFSPADYLGSLVAHHDLLVWALRTGAAGRAHLFCEQTPAFSGVEAARWNAERALSNIPAEIRAKVALKTVASLHPETSAGTFFVSRLSEFSQLAQLRRASRLFFPICAITHSVTVPNLAGVFANLLLNAEPCDAIVVTSRAAERAISSLVAQTRELLDEVQQGLGEAVRCPSVVHVPLGVDESLLIPLDKRTCRQTFGLAETDIVILYVGRLSRDYKADLAPLITGFGSLFHDTPAVKMLIAGNDPEHVAIARLEHIVQTAGLEDQVRLVPNFPPNLKHVIYTAGDIFVSPVDNVQETFGISVIEAMACGLPVVASNWSGYRDLVDSTCGYLIDTFIDINAFSVMDCMGSCAIVPHAEAFLAQSTVVDWHGLFEKLQVLVDDKGARERLGRAGRDRVQRDYRWSAVMPDFRALWERQLSEARRYEVARRRKHIRYREVFSHYPNCVADPSRTVECTRQTVDVIKQQFGANSLHARIAAQCLSHPASLSEITRHSPGAVVRSVYTLLKNGLLRLRKPLATGRPACVAK